MIEKDKRIRIMAGHYGSGKTEFALNYAVALSKISNKVALGDLDIVNVYFRSREKKEELQALGIRVISSTLKQDRSDLPAVSGEIMLPVKDKSFDYVIDLGGNDVGSILLEQLKPFMDLSEVDFFMVVNCNRPDTNTVEGIMDQKEKLETATQIKVTGFINNTNLVRESSVENLVKGDSILTKVSEMTQIPVRYITYVDEVLSEPIPNQLNGELFPMKFYMRQYWM